MKMQQKNSKTIPISTTRKQRIATEIRKKMHDANSFNNSLINIKQMITYCKDENHKSEKKYREYKILTTIKKSVDTFVIIATTSNSITLYFTGNGLIVSKLSTGIAWGLKISIKLKNEKVMQKYIT